VNENLHGQSAKVLKQAQCQQNETAPNAGQAAAYVRDDVIPNWIMIKAPDDNNRAILGEVHAYNWPSI